LHSRAHVNQVAGISVSDLEVVVIGLVQLMMAGGAIGYVMSVVKHNVNGGLKHMDWYNILFVAATILGWVWSVMYGESCSLLTLQYLPDLVCVHHFAIT
jgi:hypothetical protein